jgi:hypothetical protein
MVNAPAAANQARPVMFKACQWVPPPINHTTPAMRAVSKMDKKAPFSPPWWEEPRAMQVLAPAQQVAASKAMMSAQKPMDTD